jgi:hypothetical protein
MNLITQMRLQIPRIRGVQFIPSPCRRYPNNLILLLIEKIQAVGTFFGKLDVSLWIKNDPSIFRMAHYYSKKRPSEWQTIKQGAIFYLLLTALVIPSGICSQQDYLPEHPTALVDLYAMLDLSPPLVGSIEVSDEALNETNRAMGEGLTAEAQEDGEPETDNEPPFNNIVLQAAEEYDVDPALIKAIIMAESNNNPQAVSHRGAQGLMQLMPTTAKWLGVEDSFNPAANIDAGVRYFKCLLDRFNGDIKLALAAYNAGSRYVRKYKGVPPFKATRLYIKKVLKYHQYFINEMASNEMDPSAV